MVKINKRKVAEISGFIAVFALIIGIGIIGNSNLVLGLILAFVTSIASNFVATRLSSIDARALAYFVTFLVILATLSFLRNNLGGELHFVYFGIVVVSGVIGFGVATFFVRKQYFTFYLFAFASTSVFYSILLILTVFDLHEL